MKILITLPSHNEEKTITESVSRLVDFCRWNFPQDSVKIVIADNGSNLEAEGLGRELAERFKEVDWFGLAEPGKGAAVRAAWEKYQADCYIFLDADLAMGLEILPELVKEISQGADLAIGSRFQKQSIVERSFGRKIISQGYRFLVKFLLGLKTNDLSCGCKAVNQKVKTELLSKIADNSWFFDSELVILAEKSGFSVVEKPLNWSDRKNQSRKSRVNVFKVGWEYFKKILEIRKRLKKE